VAERGDLRGVPGSFWGTVAALPTDCTKSPAWIPGCGRSQGLVRGVWGPRTPPWGPPLKKGGFSRDPSEGPNS